MSQHPLFYAECGDGPDDGERIPVHEVRAFDGHLVVSSRHGEGYYALAGDVLQRATVHQAQWVPHPDAGFRLPSHLAQRRGGPRR